MFDAFNLRKSTLDQEKIQFNPSLYFLIFLDFVFKRSTYITKPSKITLIFLKNFVLENKRNWLVQLPGHLRLVPLDQHSSQRLRHHMNHHHCLYRRHLVAHTPKIDLMILKIQICSKKKFQDRKMNLSPNQNVKPNKNPILTMTNISTGKVINVFCVGVHLLILNSFKSMFKNQSFIVKTLKKLFIHLLVPMRNPRPNLMRTG